MRKLITIALFISLSAQAQFVQPPVALNKDSASVGAIANNGMSNGFPKANYSNAPTKVIPINNRLISTSWYAFPPGNYGGANNSSVCQQQLNSSGMAAQGWVLSGTDYCTEDNQNCTVDGLKCYAVKPY